MVTMTAWCGLALPYKINPCLRELTFSTGKLGQDAVRKSLNLCVAAPKKYREAVHEHMTVLAIDKYRGVRRWHPAVEDVQRYDYTYARWWSANGVSRQHLTSALVYGTWWNDDPLMYTWGQGWDITEGILKKLAALNDPRRLKYDGGIAGCQVDAEQHLGWHSHYGRLQYLHFMTSTPTGSSTAEQRVRSSTTDALTWMKFAYAVAMGDLRADSALTETLQREVSLPSLALNHCVRLENVKVRTLFSRLGMPLHHRNAITPDVALGSMLHILQDSFSPAHTCRVTAHDGGETKALLADVYNYNEQNTDRHSDKDLYPDWLHHYAASNMHIYANDPVAVGAWLIAAVDNQISWEAVEARLRTTIFAEANTEARAVGTTCIGS